MERTARRLAEAANSGCVSRPFPLAIYLIPFRNALFLAVVLFHGVRRLFPPY